VNVPPPPGAFPDLTPEQLDVLREVGAEREVAAGELLFQDGDHAYDFFAVVAGTVAIVDPTAGRTSGRSSRTARAGSWASSTC